MLTMNGPKPEVWNFAMQVNKATRADPNSPYRGKYLGIAGQQVVVVAKTLREVEDALAALHVPDDETVSIKADANYEAPIAIWFLRRCRE